MNGIAAAGVIIISILTGCGPGPVRRPGSWNSASMVAADPLTKGVRSTRLKDDADSTLYLVEVMGEVKPHYHTRSDETLTIHSYENTGSAATSAVSVFTPRFQGKDRHFVSP